MGEDLDLIVKGRRAVWVINGIAVTLSILGTVSAVKLGDPLIIPTVRSVVTVLLLYFLYKGYDSALGLAVVLYGWAGASAIYSAFTIGSVYGVAMGILGTGLLGISIALILSKSIAAFLKFQRAKRNS
jgi:hypothetical protein